MVTFLPLIALIVIAFTIWAILNRYQANMVLVLGGLVLNGCAVLADTPLLSHKLATPVSIFTPMELLNLISIKQLGGVGFLTLVVGGFATYMDAIGASRIFVMLFEHQFRKFRNPYLMLGATFLLGNALCFVIPSATGLAMLLIVTAYPLLTSLGCSAPAVAAVIATPMVVAYAPVSSMALLAAQTVNMEPMQYLFEQQLPLALPITLVMAVTHIFYQRYRDEMEYENSCENSEVQTSSFHSEKILSIKYIYAVLPLTPLLFTVLLNIYMQKWELENIYTAIVCAWLLSFTVDICIRRQPRKSFELSYAMFEGMGAILSTTVGLIFVAAFFAAGLQNCHIMDAILNIVLKFDFGIQGISVWLAVIVGIVTVLTGSGVAAFTSLVHLVPELTEKVDLDSVTTVLMMNTASEMMRAASPIAGVVIIVAGYAGISPFDVVKRTAVPCLVGFVTMLTVVALSIGYIKL